MEAFTPMICTIESVTHTGNSRSTGTKYPARGRHNCGCRRLMAEDMGYFVNTVTVRALTMVVNW